MELEAQIQTLISYLEESRCTVFFGGAGVSTESGIPDFRSKDGLYNQHDVQFEAYSPEYLLSHDCLVTHPKVFYEFYRQKLDTRTIEPNITHYALAHLEEKGKLAGIITQNIDSLHQKAGSKTVYEIHGTTEKNYCGMCHTRYPSDYIFSSEEEIPRCPKCGGAVRPEVVLYQEGLPERVVEESISLIQKAELLIVGGTSLTVYPAASYIDFFQGKHLVVINKGTLGRNLGRKADLVMTCGLGEVFSEVDRYFMKETNNLENCRS